MKDLLVIDQAVPPDVQDLVESIALNNKINWFRQEHATYQDAAPKIFPTTPDAIDVPQFTHVIVEDTQPVSQLLTTMLPIISAIPYTIKQLLRVKMNLAVYVPTDNPNAHGMPHVDFATKMTAPMVTAIYYVNDSSGDTLIFDQKFGDTTPLTIKARITPQKGRLIVFDANLLHAGNTPKTNQPRVNVNFNALIYEGAHFFQTGSA